MCSIFFGLINIQFFVNISKILRVFSWGFHLNILQTSAFHFCPRIALVSTANRLQTRSALIFLNHICCATHCGFLTYFAHIFLNHICCATHCNADFSHILLIFRSYFTSVFGVQYSLKSIENIALVNLRYIEIDCSRYSNSI